ncbi:hypothetical protein SERLA73DRAFT_178517, partial [Serpula lacrymans var. lacrymans S7.3]
KRFWKAKNSPTHKNSILIVTLFFLTCGVSAKPIPTFDRAVSESTREDASYLGPQVRAVSEYIREDASFLSPQVDGVREDSVWLTPPPLESEPAN